MTDKKAVYGRRPNPFLSPEVAAKMHQFLLSKSKPDRKSLAERCDTTDDQLMFIATLRRSMRLDTAIQLDRESAGVLTMQEMRPDVDWEHVKAALART